ncbi:MAG: carboxylating nicotinate-nucleotide diphosphorylase [Candidatus Peregrinibacteria bacterium]
MDRQALKEFTHNAGGFLTIDSSNYKQWVFRYTFLELEKDLGTKGDITTNSLFHKNKSVKAKIVARESGVLAGREEIMYFLVESDPSFRPVIRGKFEVNFKFKDGDAFEAGDEIAGISGDIHDLLAVERVALNLLMRMSGVATFTGITVDTVKEYDVLITPTRKTLWGLLDKKAVSLGGGGTHRLNLGDAILVKDNHLDVFGRDFEKVMDSIAKSDPNCRFVEIEVDNKKECLELCAEMVKFISRGAVKCVCAVLMDNMNSGDIIATIEELKKKNLYERLLFEASGGITEKNVVEYAKTGVDIISMGCLTGKSNFLDMSMEMI